MTSRNLSVVNGTIQGGWTACLVCALACSVVGCSTKNEIPRAEALVATARDAIEKGDNEAALQALEDSIAAEPTIWAYALRARLHAEAGEDEAARNDCDAGLQLEEENDEIKWILQELKKPVATRFGADPPSHRK